MKQRNPPASERDLDRKTGDQALRLAVLITQLCALALSPVSEPQSPAGLKAESSPACPHLLRGRSGVTQVGSDLKFAFH